MDAGLLFSISAQIAHAHNIFTEEHRKTDLIKVNSNQLQQAPVKAKIDNGGSKRPSEEEKV